MNQGTQPINIESLPSSSMVRESTVRAYLAGISRATLLRWIEKGVIPTPTKINGVRYWQAGQIVEATQKLTQQSNVAG